MLVGITTLRITGARLNFDLLNNERTAKMPENGRRGLGASLEARVDTNLFYAPIKCKLLKTFHLFR